MEESKLLSDIKESSSDRYRLCMTVCLSFIEILIVGIYPGSINRYNYLSI